MKKFWRFLIYLAVLAVLAAGVWLFRTRYTAPSEQLIFKTETAETGDVVSSISASGTVEPEELINVGAQVSGKIMSFGKDASGSQVDYGSKVTAGMVLAQIDDVLYSAELRECKAQKQQAEAAIISAEAAIKQAKAREILAGFNWNRAQELHKKKAMSKSDYDTAESNFAAARADSAAAEADLSQAKAKLAIAEAALVKAQRNMDYCVITSPVDGIIIDRRVSIGQTVVSNMSASSIFLIAKEFSRMEVWVSVNEADIGYIKPGMPVEFTVDAFPDEVFSGQVKKIRYNATMSQNVVTYVVEVTTANPDGKLIPYLTANVKFIRKASKNVLTVSTAAMRFRPEPEQVLPEFQDGLAREGSKQVWVPAEGGKLRPVAITTGLASNGKVEITGGGLKAGDRVVFGTQIVKSEAAPAEGTKSPFMPEPPKKLRGSGSAAQRERAKQNGQ